MTVRRWTVVVTLVALSLGVVRLLQLRAYYLHVATYNARWEAIYAKTKRGWEGKLAALRASHKAVDTAAERQIARALQTIDEESVMVVLFAERRRIYAERRRIYERLASHPWEAVPPDPLEKKTTGHERPVLIFEPSPGRAYEFSSGTTTRLAFAPVVLVFGYVAFRLTTKRNR
jgi:hypothetical protein